MYVCFTLSFQPSEPGDNVVLPNINFDRIIITVRRRPNANVMKITVEVIGCFKPGNLIQLF